MSICNNINCIFLSEFDPIAGPVIVYQVPESFPLRESFDAVRDLIITKPQLYDCIISVDIGGYRIIGCPKSIEDKKYARNALIFNVVLVFDEDVDTAAFEPVVRKLGDAFRTYELESSFLSLSRENLKIPEILSRVQFNLNNCGICIIPIDEINTLRLKVMPVIESPPAIYNHHVPVLVASSNELSCVKWDITIQEIFPYIDGVNHVAKIAKLSEVDLNNVKESIQHLVLYKFVKVIGIFQYSNVYVPTPKLPLLLRDKALQKKCMDYIGLQGTQSARGSCVSSAFKLLSSLEAGLTVRDMCLRSDLISINIDERKLIQFAVIYELVRQLHKYPVETPAKTNLYPDSLVLRYCDGSHCYDEICCELGVSHQDLDEEIDKLQNVIICWK